MEFSELLVHIVDGVGGAKDCVVVHTEGTCPSGHFSSLIISRATNTWSPFENNDTVTYLSLLLQCNTHKQDGGPQSYYIECISSPGEVVKLFPSATSPGIRSSTGPRVKGRRPKRPLRSSRRQLSGILPFRMPELRRHLARLVQPGLLRIGFSHQTLCVQ